MAVTACNEIPEGRESELAEKGKRSHTRKFRILTDDKDDGSYTSILGAYSAAPDPLPQRYSTHPDDSGTLCRSIKCSPDNGEKTRRAWIAVVEYNNETDERDDVENPLLLPVKYRLEWAAFRTIAEWDNAGNPIVNSAGFEFDPPYEVDDERPVLVAVKNFAAGQFAWLCSLSMYYRRAVNTANFWGAGPRQAKMESIITGDELIQNDVHYYAVTFRVQFNELTWDLYLLDRGTKHLDSSGNIVRPVILDGPQKGQPLNDAVNLNTDGTRRTEGIGLYRVPPYRYYPERDFSALGI